MAVVAYDVAKAMCAKAYKEATEQGFTQVNRLWKDQSHFNRIMRLVCAKYPDIEYKEFRDQCTQFPAEYVKVDGGGYSRNCPFLETWKVTLVSIEREWKGNRHKTAEGHEAIIDAFAAGLRGDMASLDSFFGIYDLNKEYEKELFGTTQSLNAYHTVQAEQELAAYLNRT